MTVRFLNPVAGGLVEPNPYTLRADLSKPATVGLVINKIVQCDQFMAEIGRALATLRPQLELRSYETGTITYADAALMDRVAAECDLAVCAIGHCGSCTAGTVKDGIALVERGCPAVSLVTEVFWDQASALSRSLGWPDAPRVQLPYPIWGTGQAQMQQVAQHAAREIIDIIEQVDGRAA